MLFFLSPRYIHQLCLPMILIITSLDIALCKSWENIECPNLKSQSFNKQQVVTEVEQTEIRLSQKLFMSV